MIPKGKRYENLELLKAIAILTVVIYHYNNLDYYFLNNHGIMAYLRYSVLALLSIGVPLFFFVNGMLLLNKEFSLRSHIKKIITLTILTAIWAIITLLILMPIRQEYMSITEIAKSLWNFKVDWINHLWFLQALIVLYIFFPLIKLAFDEKKSYLYFFLSFIFIFTFGNKFIYFISMIGEYIAHINYLGYEVNFFGEINAVRGIYGYSFVYFILGGILFNYIDILKAKKYQVAAVLMIFISSISLTLYGVMMSVKYGYIFDIVWNGYDTLPTLLITISVFIISLRYVDKSFNENKSKKVVVPNYSGLIRLIGKNSFGIFLVHRIWGSLLFETFSELSFSNGVLVNVAFGAVITIFSLISVLTLKKLPIITKLFFV